MASWIVFLELVAPEYRVLRFGVEHYAVKVEQGTSELSFIHYFSIHFSYKSAKVLKNILTLEFCTYKIAFVGFSLTSNGHCAINCIRFQLLAVIFFASRLYLVFIPETVNFHLSIEL